VASLRTSIKTSRPFVVPVCNRPASILASVGLRRRRIRRLPV